MSLSEAVSELALSPMSQVGLPQLVTSSSSTGAPAHSCDYCACNISRCSGSPNCCY